MNNDPKWPDEIEKIIQDGTLGVGEKLLRAGCPPEKVDTILNALNEIREVAGREINYPPNRAMSYPEGRAHARDYYQKLAEVESLLTDRDMLRIVIAEVGNIQANYLGEQYRPRSI